MTKSINLAAIATVPRYRFHLHGSHFTPWYDGVGMLFEFIRRVYRPAYEGTIVPIPEPIVIQRREPTILSGKAYR